MRHVRYLIAVITFLHFAFAGISGMGLSWPSSVYAAPSAPSNVHSFQIDMSIRVAWDLVIGAEVANYNVYRSTDQVSYAKVATITSSAGCIFDDNSIQNGSSYYYKVSSSDSTGGESELSSLTATTSHYMQVSQFAAGAATVAAIGDLNGDGKPDLVLGLPYPSAAGNPLKGKTYTTGKVDIYLGGSGKTSPSMTLVGEIDKSYFGASLAITDLNKDGYDDLIIASPMYGGKIYVYKGSARFGTTPALTITGSTPSDSLDGCNVSAVGDVNGDGYKDVTIGAPYGGVNSRGQIKVLLGGSAIAQRIMAFNGAIDNEHLGSSVIAAGDVNGDGFADILASTGYPIPFPTQDKYHLLYGGDSLILADTFFPTGYYDKYMIAGVDFNGDEKTDIIANMDNVGNIYYGGSFLDGKPDVNYERFNASKPVALGDINKDGYEDFLDATNQIVIFGTGSSTEFSTMRSLGSGAIGVGDIDKDGLKEIVSCDGTSISITSFPSLRNLPEVVLTAPLRNDMSVFSETLTIQGQVKGSTSLIVAGQATALAPDGNFQAVVHLKSGMNLIELIAKAADGRLGKHVMRVLYNVQPLTISISAPQHGAITGYAVTVSGTVNDPAAMVTVNGAPVALTGTTFQTTVSFSGFEVSNAITADASDSNGQTASSSVTVQILPKGTLSGYVTDATTGAAISGGLILLTNPLESRETTTTTTGYYSSYLFPGDYTATFSKNGYARQTITGTIVPDGHYTANVGLLSAPPLILSITAPIDGTLVTASPVTVSGTVTNNALVTINGMPVATAAGNYTAPVQLNEGLNAVTVIATDAYGQSAGKAVIVNLNSPGTLAGKVTDSTTGQALSAAAITAVDAEGTQKSTVTDGSGNYTLSGLHPGAFTTTVAATGYVTKSLTGTATAGQTVTQNAALLRIVPAISAISITSSSTTSAVVYWTTDQAADSRVDFGETVDYGGAASDSFMATGHAVTLTGLAPGTTYHYRVASTNVYGFTTTSADQIFSTPLFSARPLADSGNVAVMEVEGGYDAKSPDGTINDQPRRTIATEYFKTHGDVDFLVMLSTFDYAMPEAGTQGFYLTVKNDTQGINQPIFDNSAQFGSAGKLQGTIDMGNVTALAANPYGPKLDETLTVLNHEIGHRWGSYVRYKNPDGTLNSSLLGKDSAHWSYLLDSKGSLMYGNGWKANGDGTFTSVSKQSAYSPLDLYLMGMIPKEQVSPMLLIDNASIDKTKLPHLGDTVTGTARTVTIDDIIAAEGSRVPDAATSQKKFNVGFVLLTRPGDNTTAAAQAIETLRSAWAGRLAEQTNGVGGINGVAPSVFVTVDSPSNGATITGPDVTVSGTVINTSGVETGVTINGIPATVSGNRFIVNHVPLQLGSNAITIAATDTNGLTNTATRTVIAQTGNYLRITSNIDSGTGPLNISLNLDGSFTVANPTLTISGPVTVTLTPGASTTEFTAKLTVEGTYTITASAVGPDGSTYSDTATVTVVPRQVLETLLKGKWEGMRTAVITGNPASALNYFVPGVRYRFNAIFNDPASEITARLTEINRVEVFTVKGRAAQAGTVKMEAGKEYAYPLNFVKDGYGVWRILGF